MSQTYLLEWMDVTVTSTLNPNKNDLTIITPLESKAIIDKVIEETLSFQSKLTIQVFSLTKEIQIRILIANYHSTLIILLDTMVEINTTSIFEKGTLKEIGTILTSCLDELINFLESRFANYLSLDLKVPFTYAMISKKKIGQKLCKLKTTFFCEIIAEKSTEIVFNNLMAFVNSKNHKKFTFREVLYRKQLVKALESLEPVQDEKSVYNPLDHLLIFMNFNNYTYLNHFTKFVIENINSVENDDEKMEQLLLHYKEFSQIHSNEGLALNPNNPTVRSFLSEWFQHEIRFLEKKQHLSTSPNQVFPGKRRNDTEVVDVVSKVLCKLSTDQTALILRATSDLEILISKSMNQLFKTIVPHLSTTNKENLSYDAMRSKAYVAEERDKEIAIETLQRMIKQIKEY